MVPFNYNELIMRPYKSPQEAFQGFNFLNNVKSSDKSIEVKRVLYTPLEMIFARKWAEENKRCRYINYGYGILQDLFMEKKGRSIWATPVKIITKRERMIVATVVQWLGSNCGFSFLSEVLREYGYEIRKINEDE